jgi:uracil-DNA glycosylase
MVWTERQQRMLQAMGLRTWQPAPTPAQADLPLSAGAGPDAAPDPGPVQRPPARDVGAPSAPSPVTQAGVVLPSAPGAPGAFDAVTWDALPAAAAACQACGLCQSRQQTVPGTGAPGAAWMLVTEAPDAAEEAAGEPGAGPAALLLDKLLRAVGLSREATEPAQQVVITPAVKCRPPRDRKPDPAELAACAPLLARQVDLVQPRVILAMGKVAIRQVLGTDEPLGRLRGQVHHYRGIPVIATYDVPYLSRQPADKAKAWEDLCLAAAVVAGNAASA